MKRSRCVEDELSELMVKSNFERSVRRSVRQMDLEERKIQKEKEEHERKKKVLEQKERLLQIIPKLAEDAKELALKQAKDSDDSETIGNDIVNNKLFVCYAYLIQELKYQNPMINDITVPNDEIIESKLKSICTDFIQIAPDLLKTDLVPCNIDKNAQFMVDSFSDYINIIVFDNFPTLTTNFPNNFDDAKRTYTFAKKVLKEALIYHLNNSLGTVAQITACFNQATCLNIARGGSLKECNRILQKYQ